MFKKLRYAALFTVLAFGFQSKSQAQCLSGACQAEAITSASQICPGDTAILTGNGGEALLFNDFNNQTVGQGWETNNTTVSFNNPCGPNGVDGTPYLWFGNLSGAGQRILTSVDFDVAAGGVINFDLRFSIQAQASPCEGPDLATEGVYLQYSTDFGASWITIFYFDPNINGSGGSAASPYTQWANYNFVMPPGAQTQCTRFRWFQGGNSGAGFDHWGLDNIYIGAVANPGNTTFIWLDNGAPGNVPRPVSPTVTTDYVLMYATLVDTCYDTVTVEVLNYTPFSVDAGPDRTICPNTPQTFDGIVSGGVAPYTGTWVFPAGAGTDPLNFSPGPQNAGNFIFTASHFCEPGIFLSDTLVVTIGPPQFSVAADIDSISCFETNDGAINITVVGQTPPFTYLWTPGNINTQDLANIGPGTYSLTVTDTFGCQIDTVYTLAQPDQIAMNFIDRFICSDDSVVINPNPLPGVTYSWLPSAFFTQPNDASPVFYGLNEGPQYDTISVAVEAISAVGCGRDTFTIYLSPLPQIALGIEGFDTLVICNKDTIFLSNSLSNVDYPAITDNLWQDGATSAVYATNTAGVYWLQLTNSAGCIARDSVELIDAFPPAPIIDSIFYACGNEFIQLFATNYNPDSTDVLWSTGEFTDIISVNTAGTYTLIVGNGCAADTVTTELIQIPLINEETLPNIFTPDGNDINDVYTVGSLFEYSAKFNVKVFNRWGNKVFETEDKEINWAPKNISDGVYFMTILYVDCKNEEKKIGHSVTVISSK